MKNGEAYSLKSDESSIQKIPEEKNAPERLLFGVDSKIPAYDLLQNNIDLFEWVKRNKVYPNFWGRNINGDNCLTRQEIDFLHGHACKVMPTCESFEAKETEEQGRVIAKKVCDISSSLGIPSDTAIFLEIPEADIASRDYLKGYASTLIDNGFVPGFKANTDAKFKFDLEFSRGMQTDRDIFEKCLVWAVAPTLEEYDRITTTHRIHPDNWRPFAPSAITRNDIAVWQYGKDCHPIYDDSNLLTTFNIDLIKNDQLIFKNMF